MSNGAERTEAGGETNTKRMDDTRRRKRGRRKKGEWEKGRRRSSSAKLVK